MIAAAVFTDRVIEDLTTDLSRIENTFVISCDTAFVHRSKSLDTKQIGRDLGVRYVLEGSIWRPGPKIRALYEATYFAGLRKVGMPEE